MSHHMRWSGARWLCLSTLTASLLLLGGIQPVEAQTPLAPILQGPTASEQGVVVEAALVVQELASGTSTRIPENLLREAEGVAIIPHYIRGAFVVGVAGGRGVLLTRDEQRNWRAPEFVRMGGGSVGWQAGVQAIDLVLVFKTAKALDRIRAGKLTLGADASAAAGPLGRYTSAATDTSLQAEVYTYSRSKGLFAGVSLSGASIQPDVAATQRYYQTGQGGPGTIPTSTQTLIKAIEAASVSAIPGDRMVAAPAGPVGSPDPSLLELQSSVQSLQLKVDAAWQNYLAIPAEWISPDQIPEDALHEVLAKYERVQTHPEFAPLAQQPEFRVALQILRKVSAEKTLPARGTALPLPPPTTAPGAIPPVGTFR